MTSQYPAFGICGFSGSGKTTVIETLIRDLSGRGLAVGVVKHDVHGLNIDHEERSQANSVVSVRRRRRKWDWCRTRIRRLFS